MLSQLSRLAVHLHLAGAAAGARGRRATVATRRGRLTAARGHLQRVVGAGLGGSTASDVRATIDENVGRLRGQRFRQFARLARHGVVEVAPPAAGLVQRFRSVVAGAEAAGVVADGDEIVLGGGLLRIRDLRTQVEAPKTCS